MVGYGYALSYTESVPKEAIMYTDADACPPGWIRFEKLEGTYVVGVSSVGAIGVRVGTALTDLENRPVGIHTHSISETAHTHTYSLGSAELGGTLVDADNTSPNFNSTTSSSLSSIGVNSTGNTIGTNAPYIQLIPCEKL